MEEQITQIKNWLGTGSINIFGRPFAGKDTQGEILAEILGAELIAGGDILRSFPDQEKIKQLMSTGDLFPTDVYFDIVLPYLSQESLSNRPLILSSVGRMHGEEDTIMNATESSGHPIKAVIMMSMSEDEVWHRFKVSLREHDRGQRQDDHEEVLKNRLLKFEQQTMPVIDFYRQKGLLVEVSATGSREEVTSAIFDSLANLAI